MASIRRPKGLTPPVTPGSEYADLEDWLSTPLEERNRLAEELKFGQLPGDEERLTDLYSAPGSQLEQIRTERSRFLTDNPDFTGKNKEFGITDKYLKPIGKAFTDLIPGVDLFPRPSDATPIPDLGDLLLGHPKAHISDPPRPDLPQLPKGKSPDIEPLEIPDTLVTGDMPRFMVEEGEIIDTRNRQIISQEAFEKLAKPDERAAIEAALQGTESDDYDYEAAKKAGVVPTPDASDIDPETGEPRLHWDSRFKKDHHRNRFIPSELGIYDSKHNRLIPQEEFDRIATPDQQANILEHPPLPRDEVQGYLGNQPASASQAVPTFIPPSLTPGFEGFDQKIQKAEQQQQAGIPVNPLGRYGDFEPLTLGGAFQESGKSFLRGIGNTSGLTLKGIGLWAKELDTLVGNEKKTDDYATYRLGDKIGKWTAKTFEGRPDLQSNFLLTTLFEGAGSSVPFLATGAAGAAVGAGPGAVAGVTGALAGGAGLVERAPQNATPEQKRMGLLLGAALGATEGVPIADLFQRMNVATGGNLAYAAKVGTIQAIEEAIQEGVQQVGENAVVKYLYGVAGQSLSEGAIEGLGAGGLIGFLTGFMLSGKVRMPAALPKGGEEDKDRAQGLPPDLTPPSVSKEKPSKIGDRINAEVRRLAEQFPPTLETQKGPPKLIKNTPSQAVQPQSAQPESGTQFDPLPHLTPQEQQEYKTAKERYEFGDSFSDLPTIQQLEQVAKERANKPPVSPVQDAMPGAALPAPMEPTPSGSTDEGKVTLYRGEAIPDESKIPDYIKDDPRYQEIERDVRGRWFTDDYEIAKWYQNETNNKGRITTLQVSKDEAEQYRVSNQPDDVRRYSKDPEREFFLPKELAAQAKGESLPPGLVQAPGLPAPPQLAGPSLAEDVQAQQQTQIQQEAAKQPPALEPPAPKPNIVAPLPNAQDVIASVTDSRKAFEQAKTVEEKEKYIRKAHETVKGFMDAVEAGGRVPKERIQVYRDKFAGITKGMEQAISDLKEKAGPPSLEPTKTAPTTVDPMVGPLQPGELSFEDFLQQTRFYRSGKTKNAQVPGGERVILKDEATPSNFRETSRKFLHGVYGNYIAKLRREKGTPKAEAAPPSLEPPQAQPKQFDQKRYQQLKRDLTKAEKGGDPRTIIDTAQKALDEWEQNGQFPDDWQRWERVKEDAELKIKRNLKDTPGISVIESPGVRARRQLDELAQEYAEAEKTPVTAESRQKLQALVDKTATWPHVPGSNLALQLYRQRTALQKRLAEQAAPPDLEPSMIPGLEAPRERLKPYAPSQPVQALTEEVQDLKDRVAELEAKPAPALTPETVAQPATSIETAPATMFMQLAGTDKRYPVASYEEASKKVRQVIEAGQLGSSETSSVNLIDASGKIIGHVSYNGRVWAGRAQDWTKATTLLHDPRTDSTIPVPTLEEVADVKRPPVKPVGQPDEGAPERVEAEGVQAAPPGRQPERPRPDDREPGGRGTEQSAGSGPRLRPSLREDQEPTLPKPGKAVVTVSEPSGHDYLITPDDRLDEGGPKAKFKKNLAAIKLLKKLDAAGRLATPDEQKVLVKYTGWGGLKNAFTEDAHWTEEAKALKDVLTTEEYETARKSIQYAHYTDPKTIASIWTALQRLGLKRGSVLEPGMGTGNFFGATPADLVTSLQRSGVEMDQVSGRIAKQLYQRANIQILPFQETTFPDNHFDVAVGNVPFSEVKIADPKDRVINNLSLSLHNYFFAKALKKVRPGGVVAFITSTGTMDNRHTRAREYFASQADLIAAYRLPSGTFKGIANTEVVTDIVILRKRKDGEESAGPAWTGLDELTKGDKTFRINEYFVANPSHILGTISTEGTMYRADSMTVEGDPAAAHAKLADLIEHLPEDVLTKAPIRSTTPAAVGEALEAPLDVKPGAFFLQEDKLYTKVGDKLLPYAPRGELVKSRIVGMVHLRDLVKAVIGKQLRGENEQAIADTQASLSRTYDSFVKKHGRINSRANRLAYDQDPDYPVLQSLEKNYDPKTERADKADIFTKRTIQNEKAITTADSPESALSVVLNESNVVDFDRMHELTGLPVKELQEALRGIVYQDPATKAWETATIYLSGNVREKLKIAKDAAKQDPTMAKNVEALEAVQPTDLLPSQIDARLGAGWIPPTDIKAFMASLFNTRQGTIRYNQNQGLWSVEGYPGYGVEQRQTYGTSRVSGTELVEMGLNSQVPTIYDTDRDGKRHVNEPETLVAREKLDSIKEQFRKWIWEDQARATRLAAHYNEFFNNTVSPQFDGSHLRLPGKNPAITLRPKQLNAVYRGLQRNNSLFAHEVGTGKTFTLAALAMESRRLGLAKKPAIVVPNHLVEQWGSQFRTLYPASNLLLTSAKDFEKANRLRLMGRIATGDWDSVVIPFTSFTRLPVSKDTFREFMEQQIGILEEFIREEKASGNNSGGRGGNRIVKDLEKAKERLEEKLKNRLAAKDADDAVNFEETGIDMLLVDEADMFKNLFFPTRMQRISGLPNSESQRAYDMFLKTRYITKLNNGRGVVFATGTPISNSMAEVFTMQRYLQNDVLEQAGLGHFDAWARMFGEAVASIEMTASGKYKMKQRFANFINVPELMKMFLQVTDIVSAEEAKVERPPMKSGKPFNIVSTPGPVLKAYVADLDKRIDNLKNVLPSKDNMLKITGDGRHAALDVRLRVPGAPEDQDSKINKSVKQVAEIYRTWAPVKGTQLVFLDLSTPKGKSEKGKQDKKPVIENEAENPLEEEEKEIWAETTDEVLEREGVYGMMRDKLMQLGVKREHIAFVHDAKTNKAKDQLFADVNAGNVRILFGSTEKMGAGTNIQQRAVALHNVDAPWRPRDIEQRIGRVWRFGNHLYRFSQALAKREAGTTLNDDEQKIYEQYKAHKDLLRDFHIQVYNYATEAPSFDVYMWQTLESKAKVIAQIMKGDPNIRTIQDVDATALNAAEMKAIASGNPMVLEKVGVDADVRKYSTLKSAYDDALYLMKGKVIRAEAHIDFSTKRKEQAKRELDWLEQHPGEVFKMKVGTQTYTKREEAGEALIKVMEQNPGGDFTDLGATYRGLTLQGKRLKFVGYNAMGEQIEQINYRLSASHEGGLTHEAQGETPSGIIRSLDHTLGQVEDIPASADRSIAESKKDIEKLKKELEKPFEYEERLSKLLARQKEIEKALSPAAQPQQATGTNEAEDEDTDEGDEIAMMRVESEGGEQRAAAGMDPRIMKVLGGNLYSGDLGKIAVKEMIQNAVDSVRDLPGGEDGRVDIDVNTTTNTITVSDNGRGMTPDVATKELLDIGGSKKTEGSSGGFGIAKVAIFSNAKKIDVRTVTEDELGNRFETRLTGSGEDWMDQSKGLKVTSGPTTLVRGTVMTITLDKPIVDYQVHNWLRQFQQSHRLPVTVTARMNGKEVPDTTEPMNQPILPVEFPGGTIHLYAGGESITTSTPQVMVLNHGLPQFEHMVWLGEKVPMPQRIVANIRSNAGPETENYPFTPDRERLRGAAERALKQAVEQVAKEAGNQEKQTFLAAIRNAPSIPETPYKVFDTAKEHDPDFVQALAVKPYVKDLAETIGTVFEDIKQRLSNYDAQIADAEYLGIALGSDYLGVNITGKAIEEGRKNIILINPFTILAETEQTIQQLQIDEADRADDFAQRLVATIVHELSHQQSRGHGQEFAGALTRNQGYSIMASATAMAKIRTAITTIRTEDTPTGIFSALTRRQNDSTLDGLARDLIAVRKAWKSGTDIFGTISSSDAGDRGPRERQGDSLGRQETELGSSQSLSEGRRRAAPPLAEGAGLQGPRPDSRRYQLEANRYRAQRATEEAGFSSSDPDIEARVRAAKQGLKPESLGTRLKAHAERVWRLVSREYENLPDTAEFSPLRTDLLRLQKYKGIAADKIQRDLAAIIKPLNRKQYDQLEWKALLSDLNREAEQDRALPFGYTPEKVRDDLDRLNAVIERDPVVQEAWHKRQALWDRLKSDYQRSMEAIGFDTSKKLTKEDYFRHQVLAYSQERTLKGTGSTIRTPTGRGFLKARQGSGLDINANYVQAEFEVMAQMVYDTQVAKVIKNVDRHYNIRKQLSAEARQRNKQSIQALIDAGGEMGAILEQTMKDFKKRIGMHMGMIRKAMEMDKDEPLTMEQVQEYANDMESPANLSARGVFKAIGERKAFVKEVLGPKHVTWEQLIPETHDLWQPREGNVFYMADSIPAQMAKALQEGMMQEVNLSPDLLRKVMAMGNEREQYVIPKEAKATLEDLSQKEHSFFVEMNRSLLAHWKQLMLIAPRRVIRYNVRNLTGDSDATFVGNPKAFAKYKQAATELIPVIFKDTVLTGEAKEWAERGGYGSTLQMQELGDLNDLKAFAKTLDREAKGGWLKLPASAWNRYWQAARLSTDYREAIGRYAAYLSFLDQMRANPQGRPESFGASKPETVMALRDIRDRAFKLSNELLGAYDRVGVAGQTLRSFWVPFWSWSEVNATRYLQLAKNAFDGQDAGSVARGAMIGAKQAATFLVKMAAFWSMLQAWNLMMYGDDEDELRETNPTVANRPHVLFGRDEDGEIRYLAGIGALGDLLSWFGLDAFPGMVGDVMHDRLTIGEAVKNMAKAPVNKIVNAVTPTVKIPVEAVSRQSYYPDVFHPRPIQSRGDYLGYQTTFGPEIQALQGKPGNPLYGAEDLTGLLVQRTDPKAGAYYTWQGIERKYMERAGKEDTSLFWRSPRGQALNNWSRAIHQADDDAIAQWKDEYERMEREKYGRDFSLSKMYADMEKSLRAKAPLAGVTKAERKEILAQLDSQERRTLAKAETYYKDVLLQVLPTSRRQGFARKLERQGWIQRPQLLPSLEP